MDYIYLVLGLVILVLSGEFLVKGGTQIANHFKIPKLIIGLTIVSIGTSAPELFVSIDAALMGSPDLSIGNVVGSNIANIGLILGATTLILPISITKETTRINLPIMIGISFVLFFLAKDYSLSLGNGILLVSMLVGYILFLKFRNKNKKDEQIEIPTMSWKFAVLYIVIASVGLYYGADLLVKSSQNIALSFGVSERIVGLTVLAFGTSLPELATSIIAAIKKQDDISIGNIIGSNIFNILCVLGFTSIVKPININPRILDFDIYVMIGVSVFLLLLTISPFAKGKIRRFEGVLLLSSYVGYVAFLFLQ